MKQKPQTIQIFLPDGVPTSIKEAEITNRLVKAISFPRVKLQEALKREMVSFSGVYFLFGESEVGEPMVYVGEAENCYKRLASHNRKKDFWTQAIVIATKTNDFTKVDTKYLEHYCIEQIKLKDQFVLDNDTGSNKPSLSEGREYDLLDYFETIKTLISTLGYNLFTTKRKEDKTEVFVCQGKGAMAKGELLDNGFTVYKGSTCVLEDSPSAGTWIINMRNRLKEAKVLEASNNLLVFTKDYTFNSLSAAAGTILARRANGWIEWKDANGKTLDSLKR